MLAEKTPCQKVWHRLVTVLTWYYPHSVRVKLRSWLCLILVWAGPQASGWKILSIMVVAAVSVGLDVQCVGTLCSGTLHVAVNALNYVAAPTTGS